MRPISWIKAAQKAFLEFPDPVQERGAQALTVAANGAMPDIAKPLQGLGPGVIELRLHDRSGTYRVIYAVQIDAALWVVHAFQKKSSTGIKTPKRELDTLKTRLKLLKESLR